MPMTAAALAEAFSDPQAIVIGWAHYLAFDLWVGAWIAEDAGDRGVAPHLLLVPILLLTFLAGPLGLLVYLLVRAARRQRAAAPASA